MKKSCLVRNAVFWKDKGDLYSKIEISVVGDGDAVTVTLNKGADRWDLFMTTSEARRLCWGLHRGIMDAIAAGADV